MRYWIIISVLAFLVGGGLVVHSRSFPLYTNPGAVDRLEKELYESPEETRSQQWYQRLPEFETPRKRLSDFGRGLIAAGAGLLAALAFWRSYQPSADKRTFRSLLRFWTALWLLRIPFSFWYYGLRARRGDYPWWADSIAIPIFSESFVWLLGAGISGVLIQLLLMRHALPQVALPVLPKGLWGWIRSVLLMLWMLLLATVLYEGVRYGNEGEAFTSVPALVILYVVLCSRRKLPAKTREMRTADDRRLERTASAG